MSESVSIFHNQYKWIAYLLLLLFHWKYFILKFQDKAPYKVKAEKRKTDYNKNMQAYNKSVVIVLLIK